MGKNGQMGGVFSLKNGVFDADEIINHANSAGDKNGLKQGSGMKLGKIQGGGDAQPGDGLDGNAPGKSRSNANTKI